MGVFIDDFEKNTIIDESDEEQDEGLLIKKQGGKKDDVSSVATGCSMYSIS